MSSPRLATPNRTQYRLIPSILDDVLPQEHPARSIWSYVDGLDLTAFYATIKAVEGAPGRPPIDPKLLLALWLFATTEGIGSARLLDRLCERDLPYMWLCGGVGVNYHKLAEFRAANKDRFEELLVKHVTALVAEGVVQLKRVAQDGVRVRANAGSSSFRRRARLEQLEAEAREQVETLAKELHDDPEASERRTAAARKRAAEERLARIEQAQARAKELEEKRAASKSHKSKVEQEQAKRKVAKGEVRASTTDPDAHRMKMGDGGYRPAYNQQVAMDPVSRVIVATFTTNEGLDGGMLPPMAEKLEEAYETRPEEMVADGGFVTMKAIDELHEKGIKVYAPVDKPRSDRDPHVPLKGDSGPVGAWRERMGTDEGKEVYAQRPIVEWGFARVRNWGLRQFAVRTKDRVASSYLLYVLTHNFMLAISRQKRQVLKVAAA
jgi:transposase